MSNEPMAKLILDGEEHEYPVLTGTENEKAIDLRKLRSETGYITFDEGYGNTGSCKSNITFINEIADLCERTGADVQTVAQGIGLDQRIGPKFLHPGPGYGGSCFPKDVRALSHTAKEHGFEAKILNAVEDVNMHQKTRLFAMLNKAFDSQLNGLNIAVWGLSFKPKTDDMREAPSRVLIDALLKAGATIHEIGRAHV